MHKNVYAAVVHSLDLQLRRPYKVQSKDPGRIYYVVQRSLVLQSERVQCSVTAKSIRHKYD